MINKKGDNKNFIERYITLYFPVTIRVILVTLPYAVFVLLALDPGPLGEFILLYIPILVLGILFMLEGIKIASGQAEKEDTYRMRRSKKVAIVEAFILLVIGYVGVQIGIQMYENRQLSVDNSVTWQKIGGNLTSDNSSNMISHIKFIDDKRLLIGGSNGVFATENGGNNWKLIKKGNVMAMKKLAENQMAIFVGEKGGIQMSFDGGVSWQKTNYPKQGNLTAIYPISKEHFFGRTFRYGLLLETNDAGKTWQVVNLPIPPEKINNTLMIEADNNNIYVFNDGLLTNGYKSTDGGKRWIKIPTKSTDPSLKFDEWAKPGRFVINGNTFYVVVDYNKIYKTGNGGVDWQKIDTRGIHFIDNIWVINKKTIYAIADFNIYQSKDGGKNWVILGNWPKQINATSLAVSKDGTLFIGTNWSSIYKAVSKDDTLKEIESNRKELKSNIDEKQD